ncbi:MULTISPECIES: hydroxymethylbilane synthase [unclassified Leucobacter]|uniref:hydroxymethylbilane synthase n=1 Tax=unclassified Leucobacter TaxID=2621730 RepID=UPI000B2DF2CF|nr:hydroxymethylbilane synthase [Leucobacter sp. L43]
MNASLPSPSGRVFRSDAPLAPAPGLLRVGTRGSALAVSQTTMVAEQMATATGLDVALVIITTHGDVTRAPLSQLGGTGVFVSALRDALLAGECDLAVHSLKDLPTGACAGISLGAVPVRADARDALCARDGLTLADLPVGARVGTGSPRRAAQIRARRSDIDVHDLRGNVDTRLGRVGVDLDAVVLAAAGLDRLGRAAAITERFPLTDVPAAPGQGALAIEVRAADATTEPYIAALSAVDDAEARATALAERSLLATLEAGCAAPIGACAEVTGDELRLRAVVYRVDGSEQLTAEASLPWSTTAPDSGVPVPEVPAELGRRVAAELLAAGAADLAPLGGRA